MISGYKPTWYWSWQCSLNTHNNHTCKSIRQTEIIYVTTNNIENKLYNNFISKTIFHPCLPCTKWWSLLPQCTALYTTLMIQNQKQKVEGTLWGLEIPNHLNYLNRTKQSQSKWIILAIQVKIKWSLPCSGHLQILRSWGVPVLRSGESGLGRGRLPAFRILKLQEIISKSATA